MKFAIVLFLLTPLAIAQTSTASAPASSAIPTNQENARKARAIVDKAIQALGGQAYLTWRTQSSQGRSYTFHNGEANSRGVLFWRFREFPDKDRFELTKKRDWIEIFNGDKGYEITFRGIRNLDDKDELQPYLRRRHYALDVVLRTWLNQPGLAFFYEGQTVAAQKETDQVTILNARNEGVTLNFDINSHLPVKRTFSWRDPTDEQRNTEGEIYDNYRPIQGIMTPFVVTRTYNGQMSAQTFLNAASYNEDFKPDFFDPQAAAKRR
jgi:hypothetical protein